MEQQEPAKRVVKRVVKKTVVRPGPPPADAPAMRYGRPVAATTATKPKAKVAAKPQTGPAAKAGPSKTAAPRPRPRVAVGSTISSAGSRVRDAWWVVADATSDGARTAGSVLVERAKAVAAWRLPHINLYLASIITGAVVGLVSVLIGYVSLTIFESVRGVSSGGGLWGGIVFVAVAVVAVALGEGLLRGFGSTAARLTSVLAVVLTLVAMLSLFLGLLDSWTALAVVPVLGVGGFVLSHWLIDLAENTPAVVD